MFIHFIYFVHFSCSSGVAAAPGVYTETYFTFQRFEKKKITPCFSNKKN